MGIPVEWRRILLGHPCPACNAKPGEKCRNLKTGAPVREFHAARANMPNRCRICGARLPADDPEPGGLCERCLLVRSLELERMRRPRPR